MKNLIIILGILLMCSPVFAGDMEPVLNNTKLFYSPKSNLFSIGKSNDGDISISKNFERHWQLFNLFFF